ncbi:hypothetical protein HWV62_45751 [Athelia sp. TMB]|nr:hypothetical protein HWV62_45751 [Athelia sp. TMB]
MKCSAILAVIVSSIALVRASGLNSQGHHAAPARRSRLAELPDTEGDISGPGANSTYDKRGKKHGVHKAATSSGQGLINVKSTCGAIGATKEVTATSGPNGNMDWLNCGITGAGWTPPFMTVNDIVHEDLATALQDPNSPFKACSAFTDAFYQFGNEYGVPPILLASFALQESSCNPKTIGGAGEQGLMQITKDKCARAPGGNCLDPYYNIQTGAQFFAGLLKGNNGDLLRSIGSYNGWFHGMTYNDATAAAKTKCCHCQNNLD